MFYWCTYPANSVILLCETGPRAASVIRKHSLGLHARTESSAAGHPLKAP